MKISITFDILFSLIIGLYVLSTVWKNKKPGLVCFEFYLQGQICLETGKLSVIHCECNC